MLIQLTRQNRFVTPEQRHLGHDVQLLQKRTQLYAQARDLHPHRWSKNTRNWDRVNVVHLNPDKPEFKERELNEEALESLLNAERRTRPKVPDRANTRVIPAVRRGTRRRVC